MNDKEPHSPGQPDIGRPPRWVRWGCTALLLVFCGGLALYMFGT